jgi:hypothetical protein
VNCSVRFVLWIFVYRICRGQIGSGARLGIWWIRPTAYSPHTGLDDLPQSSVVDSPQNKVQLQNCSWWNLPRCRWCASQLDRILRIASFTEVGCTCLCADLWLWWLPGHHGWLWHRQRRKIPSKYAIFLKSMISGLRRINMWARLHTNLFIFARGLL